MKLKSLLMISFALLMNASQSNALVSVIHTNDTGGALVDIGDTFNVDVTLSYDGTPSEVVAILVSAIWDPEILQFNSATDSPFVILPGMNGALGRLVNPTSFLGDPDGTLRTVQHAAHVGQYGSVSSPVLMTTLNFTVIGLGLGSIDVTLLDGDRIIFNGSGGQENVGAADLLLSGTTVNVIPEPSTALLVGLGLAGLAGRTRRRVSA